MPTFIDPTLSPRTHSRLSWTCARIAAGVGWTVSCVERGLGACVVGVCGARADNIMSSTGLPVVSTAWSTAVIAHTLMVSTKPHAVVESSNATSTMQSARSNLVTT